MHPPSPAQRPPIPSLSAEGIERLADQPSRWKGWTSIVLVVIFAPVGLIFGILALRQARRDGDRTLRTLGTVGTILNGLSVALLAVVLISVLTGAGGTPAGALRLDTLGGDGLATAPARPVQLQTALRRQLVSGFASVNEDVAVGRVRCHPGADPLRYVCDTTLTSKSDASATTRARLAVATTAKGHWSVAGVS